MEKKFPDTTINILKYPEFSTKLIIQEKCQLEPKVEQITDSLKREFNFFKNDIDNIQRCTRCILPATFPFIEFDSNGVCNYCNSHVMIKGNNKGEKSLFDEVQKFKKSNGEPDCLISISGGRDSCYGLHYAKKVLGLTPIAYTYDWGMVTPLARRNIARMCGKLGVEHILISADILKKRKNIQKNLVAWEKSPDLGMIPLLMAGDKQFLYYTNEIMENYNIDLSIMCMNRYEISDFKEAFCGLNKLDIKQSEETWGLAFGDTLTLLKYYLRQYLNNRHYFNLSIFDNIFAFYSYFFAPKNNLYLFNYIDWDEKLIIDTLINMYDWELAPDTKSTWRIGDGTAPLYNYVYYIIAGFSENDTFLSKLIRDGQISRDEALNLCEGFNAPRYESLKWYAEALDISLNKLLLTIHNMQKKYPIDNT